MMKRASLLTALMLSLLLMMSLAVPALASEIRPLETDPDQTDLKNGTFSMTVKDSDRIGSGGFFTAELYRKDRYDGEQIRALSAGDTVTVSGKDCTVTDVVIHDNPEGGTEPVVEIGTAEGDFGYVAFIPLQDGSCYAMTDDWSPVSSVGELQIMLPLPNQFRYFAGEAEAADADAFLREIEENGDRFSAYNTECVVKDGMLTEVTHSDYPEGPQEEPAAEAEAVPVWKFFHAKSAEGLETAVVTCYTTDCETGLIPEEITEEEAAAMRRLAMNGVVTAKANDLSVTGGTWVYTFETPDGRYLMSIEMYKGLMVGRDGMYNYQE